MPPSRVTQWDVYNGQAAQEEADANPNRLFCFGWRVTDRCRDGCEFWRLCEKIKIDDSMFYCVFVTDET
jgi:hypothetical protein